MTLGGTPLTRSRAEPCPPGFFCPGDGISHDCPAGRYGSDSGLSDSDCSGPCTAAFYCPLASVNSTSVVRLLWSLPRVVLPVTRHDLSPRMPADMQPCGSVDVYCPTESSAPLAVSEGFYSLPTTASPFLRHSQQQCERGRYCIAGQKVRTRCDSADASVQASRHHYPLTRTPAAACCAVHVLAESVCSRAVERRRGAFHGVHAAV